MSILEHVYIINNCIYIRKITWKIEYIWALYLRQQTISRMRDNKHEFRRKIMPNCNMLCCNMNAWIYDMDIFHYTKIEGKNMIWTFQHVIHLFGWRRTFNIPDTLISSDWKINECNYWFGNDLHHKSETMHWHRLGGLLVMWDSRSFECFSRSASKKGREHPQCVFVWDVYMTFVLDKMLYVNWDWK